MPPFLNAKCDPPSVRHAIKDEKRELRAASEDCQIRNAIKCKVNIEVQFKLAHRIQQYFEFEIKQFLCVTEMA